MDHTMRKSMKNCAQKKFRKLYAFLFEATCAFGKMRMKNLQNSPSHEVNWVRPKRPFASFILTLTLSKWHLYFSSFVRGKPWHWITIFKYYDIKLSVIKNNRVPKLFALCLDIEILVAWNGPGQWCLLDRYCRCDGCMYNDVSEGRRINRGN